MKHIKYEYKIVKDWIDTHPVIRFYLHGYKKPVLLKGLVDTGAYYTIMHSIFADEAGINLPDNNNQNIITANGIISGKRVNVYLNFFDEFSRASIKIKSDVVFIDNLKISKEAVLLGRAGIFNKFKEVAFSENTINKNIKFKY